MSPEQAKGKAADRRADIWAFGVLLYEMLTGGMMFSGETASETMAQVMLKEPDWTTLPAKTPVRVRDLLRRCYLGLVTAPIALSPNGQVFAFVATGTGPRQFYTRRLDRLEAVSFAGTEGARAPFFSPDGQWIAFFADGKLKKIPVTGGAPLTLCEALDDRGGYWAEDGSSNWRRHHDPSNRRG